MCLNVIRNKKRTWGKKLVRFGRVGARWLLRRCGGRGKGVGRGGVGAVGQMWCFGCRGWSDAEVVDPAQAMLRVAGGAHRAYWPSIDLQSAPMPPWPPPASSSSSSPSSDPPSRCARWVCPDSRACLSRCSASFRSAARRRLRAVWGDDAAPLPRLVPCGRTLVPAAPRVPCHACGARALQVAAGQNQSPVGTDDSGGSRQYLCRGAGVRGCGVKAAHVPYGACTAHAPRSRATGGRGPRAPPARDRGQARVPGWGRFKRPRAASCLAHTACGIRTCGSPRRTRRT